MGSTTIDETFIGDRSCHKLGGVTTYAGITYRRHGIPVSIVSNMAEHDLKLMDKLTTEGISVFTKKSKHSTYFVTHNEGDIRYQELLRQAKTIRVSQIQSILGKIDCLHLGPLHPNDIEAEALKLLQNSGRMVILDLQGYTRLVRNQKVLQHVCSLMPAALKLAHIAKANESEAEAILKNFGMSSGELVDRFEIEEFVVTLGKKGGYVKKRNGELFYYDAAETKASADPTGAGDVFLAAYVIARTIHKKDIPEACRSAAKIAAQQVEGNYITGLKLRIR